MSENNSDREGRTADDAAFIIEARLERENTEQEKVERADEQDLKARLLSADHWLRLAFMLLFALVLCVVTYVVATVVALQFIWHLAKGEANSRLKHFGRSLSRYIEQVLCFLTYNSEDKPFPFADWPDSKP